MFQEVCHGFEIVGLPDTSIREAKERVKTAIKNSGYELQSRKIVVNLAPADTKKEGPVFDLPIAVGILIANRNIINPKLRKNINGNNIYRRIIFKWKHRKNKWNITNLY